MRPADAGGRKAHLALRVQPAQQVPLVRADLEARKGRKVPLVRKAPPVSVAKRARLARKDRSVRKVRRAKLVHKGRQGPPASAAKQDRKAPQVRPVQVRTCRAEGRCRAHHLRSGLSPAQITCVAQAVGCGVSLVCTSGATDGAKCATPGTPATALCVRK